MKTRYRLGFESTGLFTKTPVLILQVFAHVDGVNEYDASPSMRAGYDAWRDATVADLPTLTS